MKRIKKFLKPLILIVLAIIAIFMIITIINHISTSVNVSKRKDSIQEKQEQFAEYFESAGLNNTVFDFKAC